MKKASLLALVACALFQIGCTWSGGRNSETLTLDPKKYGTGEQAITRTNDNSTLNGVPLDLRKGRN